MNTPNQTQIKEWWQIDFIKRGFIVAGKGGVDRGGLSDAFRYEEFPTSTRKREGDSWYGWLHKFVMTWWISGYYPFTIFI